MVLPPCGISKKIGDVDGDGDITQADVDLAFNLYGSTVTKDQTIRLDVNGNGRFDGNDIILIGQYARGEITTFPVCTRSNRYKDASITLDAEATGEGTIYYEWIITQPDLTEIIPHPTSISYTFLLSQAGTYTVKLQTSDSCSLGSQSCSSPNSGVYYIDVTILCVEPTCTFVLT